jgi:hypothetical protein
VIEPGFPIGACVRCARDVLTYLTLDDRGREARCCVHCDAELDPVELRWVPEDDLGGFGYAVERAGGCGSGGCGNGGCGRRGTAV